MSLRSRARGALGALGYDLRRVSQSGLGRDPFLDVRVLAGPRPGLVVADVGANLGQTVSRVLESLPAPVIHSFEPSPSTFAELRRRTAGIADLHLSNCAVGSEPGVLELNENTLPTMSSILENGAGGAGDLRARTPVTVTTLDEYCAARSIERLDVVKSDTQGYDLEVLKGAERLFARRSVGFVLVEVIFGDLYEGVPRVERIFEFLRKRGFDLVSFYDFGYQGGRASWADALFAHREDGA
jgi:FkbM family methyltransferase